MSNKSNFQESIFNSIGDAIIVANKSGEITQINPMAESLIGLSAIDAKGKSLEAVFNVLNTLTGEEYQDLTQHVINSGMVIWQSLNTKLITHSKKECLITGSANTLKDSKGTIEGVVISFREVAGLEQTEKLVSDARAQFKNLFNLSPIPTIFTSLPERIFIDINNATESLLGYKREDLIGHSTLEFDIFAVKEEREEIIRLLSDKGYVKGVEAQILTSRGETITCTLYIEILNQQGRTYSITQLVDVTEHRKIKKELVEKDILFHTLVEKSSEAITVVNEKGNAVYASPTAIAMLGYTAEELNKMRFNEIMHPDDIQMVEKVFVEVMQVPGKEVKLLGRQRQKSGEYIWCEGVATNWFHDPVINGIVVNFRDVTERILADNIKHESEARFTTLFKLNPSPVGITRASNYSIVDVNEAWCKMTGYSSNEAIGCTSTELKLTHTNTLAQIRGELQKHNKFNPLEISILTRAGKERRVVMSSELIKLNGEDFFINTFLDITELKQAERESNEVRQLFQFLFNFSPVAYSLGCLSDRRIVDVNSAWETLFGYSKEEIVGKLATNFNFWQNPDERDAAYKKLKDDGRLLNYRANILTKSGNKRSTSMYSEILEQSGVKYMFSVFIDITESEISEEAIRISLAKYKTLFENFPMGITVSDKKGNIIESNVTAEKLLGISAEEQARRQLRGEEWQIVRTDGTPMPAEEYASVRALNEGRKIENVEMGIVKPDKTITWINVTAAPIPLEDYGVVVTYNDITTRKQAEAKVLETQENYKNIFDNNPLPMWVYDIETLYFLEVNEAAIAKYGYSRNEFFKMTILDIRPKEDYERLIENVASVTEGIDEAGDWRHIKKNGSLIDVEITTHTLTYFGRKAELVLANDVTERKQSQEKLRQSQLLLRQVLDSEPDAIFAVDLNYKLLINNKRHQQVLVETGGRKLNVGESILPSDYLPEVLEYWRGLYGRAFSGEEFKLEMEWPYTDGKFHTIECSFSPLRDIYDKIMGALVVIHDITERKQGEVKLQESLIREQFLGNLIRNASIAVGVGYPDGRLGMCNLAFQNLTGYTEDELKNIEWNTVLTPVEWLDKEMVFLSELERTKQPVTYEKEYIHKSGKRIPIELVVHPFYSSDGDVTHYYAFITDITERKKAKLDLESSESKFRSIAENLTDVIAITDTKGVITYISPASLGVFGYNSDEMMGRFFGEFLAPDEKGRLEGIYNESIELDVTSHNLLIKALKKNGEIFYAELSSSKIIEDGNINGRLALIRDVTGIRMSEMRERNRSRILQMLTEEFKLKDILYEIQLSIEEEVPDNICTILLIDKTGKHLQSIVPNKLPDFYNKAVDGLEIGMGVGSCGTAAYSKESVFVENVLNHPYWEPFKEIAQKANFVSCWSKPIISFTGQVLGTFAIYGRKTKLPNEAEIARIDYAANLTRLAIEKKTSEEELLASEAKFRAVFDNAPVGISLIDSQRNLLDSNNMLSNIVRMDEVGLAAGNYRARKYIREDGSEIPVSELASARAIAEKRSINNFVNGIVLESGDTIWTQVSAAPLGPNDSRYVVITQDITERKLAIAALEENEHRLRKTLETTSDGFWIVDSNRKFIEVNEAYCKMSGYTREELMNMSISDVEVLEATEDTNDRIKKIISEGSDRFDTVHRRKDGSIFNVEVSVNILDHERGLMICFCRDITDRKVAEKDLLESEKRFSTIFEDSPVAIAISRLNNGEIILVNESAINLFGFSLEEFIGKTTLDLGIWARPDDRQRFMELIRINQRVEEMETSIQLKNREKRRVLLWGELIEQAGEPCVMVEIIDITERKRAEQQLLEREADLINALELARMGSWHIDLSNYKLSVSENYKRLIGVDNDNVEITFDFFINRIHPEDAALMKLEQYNLSPESPPVVFDFRFIMPDDSIRWFQNSMIGEFSEGELIALKGTNIDITEKKNREEEIRKINETLEQRIAERTAELSDLYNNAPCGYHSLNSDGIFDRINDTELNWLGYSQEELVGKLHTIELLTDESKAIFKKIFPEFKKRGKIEGLELDFIRKDGSIISVLLNATAVYDEHGNYIHSRSTIIDNTERKKAEIALREAQQAADKANIAKSEFLSRMSHELRTPLNSILGFAQLLEMGELNPNQQKGVTHIMKSGKHLLDLINEVLDISRIEAGRLSLSPEPVQLQSVISETIDIVRPLANEKNIRVELDKSPLCNLYIKADRQRVKQILINLINNGIKYNNNGGYVKVECNQLFDESKSNQFVRISIIDNGYGISEENLINLFTPFERAGAEKTTIEGTGLGLAVAKKLVEAMGGIFGVESKLNEGSTFWIQFPQCESQLEVIPKLQEVDIFDPTSTTKKGTILYVEDNIPNIELIEQVLDTKFKSIKLVTTRFGKETVDLAIEHKPNLILLDLNLPDTHGSDVFEELKGNSQTVGIPVVVISADAMPNQLNRLLNAGVKQYLTKPLDISEFLKVVSKYVDI